MSKWSAFTLVWNHHSCLPYPDLHRNRGDLTRSFIPHRCFYKTDTGDLHWWAQLVLRWHEVRGEIVTFTQTAGVTDKLSCVMSWRLACNGNKKSGQTELWIWYGRHTQLMSLSWTPFIWIMHSASDLWSVSHCRQVDCWTTFDEMVGIRVTSMWHEVN